MNASAPPTTTPASAPTDARERLCAAGLRPTRQRIALAECLFTETPRHVTAETLYAEAISCGERLSLGTVYNTLHAFTAVNLVRQVTIDGARTYFDTNVAPHHHLFHEDDGALTDIPADQVTITGLPDAPEGSKITSIDVIVRVSRGD